MVERACGVGVVRNFVIVPHGDEGMPGVQFPETGISAVERVALAVIVKGDGLLVVAGRQGPSDPPRVLCAETRLGSARASVLVYVVAQENHGVYVRVVSGRVTVDVEVALLPVGAREHRQGDPAHVARGKGLGASGHGGFASRPEAVVVDRRRRETLNVDFYRVVGLGRRGELGGVHDVREPVVGGDFNAHAFGRFVRGDSGPENYPVRKRIAARHPVAENRVVGVAAPGDGDDRQGDEKR